MTNPRTLTIGGRAIMPGGAPYVIAEIGVNHEGDMATARRLIELAAEGGADAAKFQTYKADRIAARQSPAYWDTSEEATTSQFELFTKYDRFGPAEYAALADHCARIGIDFMSTPFDLEAVDAIDPLVAMHKIASADITNLPLIRRVASKGKPVLLSTGASTLEEVDRAVAELKAAGCPQTVILQCTLNYPCPDANANLNMIEGLARRYPDNAIGYSDHTRPDPEMLILTAAWLKGAVVLEKHFTHDKTLPGNDHYHAMDVDDLKRFRRKAAYLQPILGVMDKAPLADEQPARDHARRSIVVDGGVKKGDVLTESNLCCKRPAHGISPLHWDRVLGRHAARDLADDTILQWEDLA